MKDFFVFLSASMVIGGGLIIVFDTMYVEKKDQFKSSIFKIGSLLIAVGTIIGVIL